MTAGLSLGPEPSIVVVILQTSAFLGRRGWPALGMSGDKLLARGNARSQPRPNKGDEVDWARIHRLQATSACRAPSNLSPA